MGFTPSPVMGDLALEILWHSRNLNCTVRKGEVAEAVSVGNESNGSCDGLL